MKKVVVASLLAVASAATVARVAVAQTQVNLGSNAQQSGGGVQLAVGGGQTAGNPDHLVARQE